jgi:hypothetical protein
MNFTIFLPNSSGNPTDHSLLHFSSSGRHAHRPLCHCGTSFADCDGCGAERCLACDPYSSDDCRYPDV